MKRLSYIFIVFLLVLGPAMPAYAQAQSPPIIVNLDGFPVNFDVQPIIHQGRTLVPFRAMAEALNIDVSWDGQTQTVTAVYQENQIRLQINNTTAYLNSTPIPLDVPPFIINGRTLIPLRFFAENLGCQVDWDSLTYTVKIISPPKAMKVVGFYALGDSKTSSWKSLFGTDYPEMNSGNTDLVNELALGWYSLDDQGNLLVNSKTGWQRPSGWEKVLEAAHTYNLKTEMVIHLPDRDATFAALVANEAALNKAVLGIVEEARKYQGVNLDIEGLGWKEQGESLVAVRDNFTGFVRLLSNQLKTANLSLTLTLHPPNSAYKGYDYKALGSLADQIIIMAYDYGTKPEPLSLVNKAVEVAKGDIPADKLLLGISAPNETADSILTKIGLAKRHKLKGIAIWRLGLVPKEMWEALRTSISIESR